MKKYLVREVYCGCEGVNTIVDTREEAEMIEKRCVQRQIEDFGEEALYQGIGDYCVYIDEIEVSDDASGE